MDPIEQFRAERRTSIAGYAGDSDFKTLSSQWLELAMERRYVYNFDWLGRPIIQCPQDVQAVQEIVWRTRPDVIVETGIAHGGSLILNASLLALLDLTDAIVAGRMLDPSAPRRKVIGVDIDIREHNKQEILKHPLANRIQMIEGSSIDAETIAQIGSLVSSYNRVMVCLDSMHTHDHVLHELRSYAPMVTEGCYCVVFDSFVEDLPTGTFADRPWDVGNNPKTAIWEFLKETGDFKIDTELASKLMLTSAPDGFLQRVAS